MRCNAGPCRSMAEEPKPEVAVEQEAAATNGDGDAAAKSGKSFEERLAELKKPEAVPQPKEDEVNAQLSKLNSEITTWDKRLTEIKSAIEKASAARDGGRSESKDIVEKLKAVRAKIKAASSEREDVFQQLRELTQARQLQANAATDASASVPAHRMSTEEIEYARAQARAALNELAAQRAAAAPPHSHEIKQLNQTKGLITQYQSQRQNKTDDTDSKSSLEEGRAAATKRLDDAKKEAEKLEKELEKMREKQDKGAPNMNKLWKEQKELYGKIKEHRATIRTVKGEFKE